MIDPIELELMRNLFEAAAEQMGLVLQRVAFSANIKERRDFSCAIFLSDGQLVAQAAHIPVHLGSMAEAVSAIVDRLGVLGEGESAIVNDPYAGGTHLPDITIVAPVYHSARLVAYVANRAHHADVGGTSPGSMTLSRHIDQEGVRIEPSRWDEHVMKRLLDAARTPDERRGDVEAQLAANRVGAAAIEEIIRRNGVENFHTYGRALIEYAASFLRRAIASIPDGEYRFEDVMDDDGAGSGPVAIRATVRIQGERATVDLSESADQAAGCINCPAAVTRSAVYYCFGCLLEEGAPLNVGAVVNVTTRPGSVLHATYPAAVVAGNTETSQRVVDVVLGALAQAMPGRIPAASCGTMSSIALGGAGWTHYETIGGGAGAGPGWHGESAVQCHMTNTLNTPAEALEMQYPLRVTRSERATGTGGIGTFIGGDGIVRELLAIEECEGTVLSDRRASRPYGLQSADPGAAGANAIVRANGSIEPLAGKARFTLHRGDTLRLTTPGGGGHGRAAR